MFIKGMRVICTDEAIRRNIFKLKVMGTVHRTPNIYSPYVSVVRDGNKTSSIYARSFWQETIPEKLVKNCIVVWNPWFKP